MTELVQAIIEEIQKYYVFFGDAFYTAPYNQGMNLYEIRQLDNESERIYNKLEP